MTGKNRGESKGGPEDTPDASSTAVDLNRGKTVPAIRVPDLPDRPPSSDPGTPLPDDSNLLKENVKGLKNQLRKHKQKVLPL